MAVFVFAATTAEARVVTSYLGLTCGGRGAYRHCAGLPLTGVGCRFLSFASTASGARPRASPPISTGPRGGRCGLTHGLLLLRGGAGGCAGGFGTCAQK